jgi:hypothetical protein
VITLHERQGHPRRDLGLALGDPLCTNPLRLPLDPLEAELRP